MDHFELHSEYKPTGDQPQAIAELVKGFKEGNQFETLLGVTGSGKTFTMANVIAQDVYKRQILGNLFHFQSEHNIFNYGSPWEKCILLKYNSSFYSGSLNGFAVQVYVSAGKMCIRDSLFVLEGGDQLAGFGCVCKLRILEYVGCS